MYPLKPEEKLIPYSGAPEIYTLIGVIFFLACSFVTHFFNVSEIFGRFLARFLTIFYQIAALVGLGQMFFLNFVYRTNLETRAVMGFMFLVTAIINMVVFIGFTLKESRYLSYYFRFTFDRGPVFLLRVMDAFSEVKASIIRLFP